MKILSSFLALAIAQELEVTTTATTTTQALDIVEGKGLKQLLISSNRLVIGG